METLNIRIYTKDGEYKSSRVIKIKIDDLYDYIKENYLNEHVELTSFHLEGLEQI